MNELATIDTTAIYQRQPATINTGLFQSYLDYINRRPSTMKGYITCLRQFAKWMQDTGTTAPQRADILAYKEYLDGAHFGRSGTETIKAGTKQQYLRAVKSFFKWTSSAEAILEGRYWPNVADNIHSESISTDHKKKALKREAVPVVADTIDRTDEKGKRLYAMYLLCISCGLRTVEISRANVGDIATEDSGRTYLYLWGKGHSEPDQPVLLIPEVKDALQAYLDSRTDHYTKKSPLFVGTSNKGRPGTKLYKTVTDPVTGEKEKVLDRISDGRIAPTTISTMLKGALVAAGYDSDRLTAHSLRHTSGTGAYKATGNIYLAQKHQRHVDPATTEIYVHAEEREERDTERQVYDYYFKPDTAQDDRQEAINLLSTLNPAKLHQVCEFIRAIR